MPLSARLRALRGCKGRRVFVASAGSRASSAQRQRSRYGPKQFVFASRRFFHRQIKRGIITSVRTIRLSVAVAANVRQRHQFRLAIWPFLGAVFDFSPSAPERLDATPKVARETRR